MSYLHKHLTSEEVKHFNVEYEAFKEFKDQLESNSQKMAQKEILSPIHTVPIIKPPYDRADITMDIKKLSHHGGSLKRHSFPAMLTAGKLPDFEEHQQVRLASFVPYEPKHSMISEKPTELLSEFSAMTKNSVSSYGRMSGALNYGKLMEFFKPRAHCDSDPLP